MLPVNLKKITVRRFKQFKNVVFDLSTTRDYSFNTDALTADGKLVKTALIYGRNGAGKSNLGLAVMDLTLHLTDNIKNFNWYRYYINADAEVRNAEFSYEFLQGDNVYRYEYVKESPEACLAERFFVNDDLVFDVDRRTNKWDMPGAEKYGFSTLRVEGLDISLLKYIASNSNLPNDSPIVAVMNFVRRMLFFKRVDSGNNFIGLENTVDTNLYGYIVQNNFLKEFENFLREGGIAETLEANQDKDYQNIRILFKRKEQSLPIDEVGSSGTQAMALLFYWMKHFDKASFVFIDEFDAFYHAELAEIIYKKIKQFEKENSLQCVLTTHNTNLLSNRINRPDCCYIVTSEEIASLPQLTSREIREGNNVENLYLANAFGVM